MPRAEEENQRIRDERKEKIIDAAICVFARKGLVATKISDIASQSKISLGLFYHYFSSKEQLFSLLVEKAIESVGGLIQQALAQQGSPLTKIRWLATTMLNNAYENPDGYLMLIQALGNEAILTKDRELLQQNLHATFELFVQLVKEGQALGEIAQDDPEELTKLYFVCIQGIALDISMFGHLNRSRIRVDTVLRILKP